MQAGPAPAERGPALLATKGRPRAALPEPGPTLWQTEPGAERARAAAASRAAEPTKAEERRRSGELPPYSVDHWLSGPCYR